MTTHTQFYFYLSDIVRLRFCMIDEHALLTEQRMSVQDISDDTLSQWVDGQQYVGVRDQQIGGKPDDVSLLSALQRNATILVDQERLKVAVRALECIHRFTRDNYARDALRELQNSGWPVDWYGDKVQRKPIVLATMNLAKDEMWCCGINFKCGSKPVEGEPVATARFQVLWDDTLLVEVFNSAATPVIDWQNESVTLTGPGVLTLQAVPIDGDAGLLFGKFT